MLAQRLTLGPLLIALIIAAAWLDAWIDRRPAPDWVSSWTGADTFPPGTVIFFLILAIVTLAGMEVSRILRASGVTAAAPVTVGAAVVGLLASAGTPSHFSVETGLALTSSAMSLVFLVAMVFYARHRTLQGVVAAAGGALLAYVYLGLLPGFLLLIRREHSVWALLAVVLIVKSADIGAYFTGRALGRRKLIPWLSPGKTWEGLIGGLLLATVLGVTGASLSHHAELEAPIWLGAVGGAALGLLGQLGDLVASLFKRGAGIKDSSHALPGFGGVLDVLDSPLVAAPAAFWLLRAAETASGASIPGAAMLQ